MAFLLFLENLMVTKFARLNLKLKADCATKENIEKWQQILTDAALNGCADDAEVFYVESKQMMGVSIAYDDEMTLLEAGVALGFCQRSYQEAEGNIFEYSSLALYSANGTVIESTYEA
jgi:hypothetical protein